MNNTTEKEMLEQSLLINTPKEVYAFGSFKDVSRGDKSIPFGEIEVSNTLRHQYTSLLAFAAGLGYEQDFEDVRMCNFGAGFLYKDPKHERSSVSFNTMVRMHNTNFMPHSHHGIVKELPRRAEQLGYPLEDTITAINNKLYKRVHLCSKTSRSRTHAAEKVIVVQKHIIDYV